MFVCNTKLITCFSLILFLGFCNNRAKVVGTWRLSHKQGSNTVLSEYSSLWQGLCNQNRCQTGYSVQTLNCCTLTSFKEFLQGVRRQMVWVTNGSSALEFQLLDLLWSFAPKVKGKNDKFGKAKQLFISFAGQGVKKAFHVADQSKFGHCEFLNMGCIQACWSQWDWFCETEKFPFICSLIIPTWIFRQPNTLYYSWYWPKCPEEGQLNCHTRYFWWKPLATVPSSTIELTLFQGNK